jgi:hypothetical protein
MMTREARILIFNLFLCAAVIHFNVKKANAQSTNLPLNSDYYHILDRLAVKSGSLSRYYQATLKPYRRDAVAEFVESLNIDSLEFNKVDKFNINYIKNDNWSFCDSSESDSRKPFLKIFYRKKADFVSVMTKDFELHLNPVLHFSGGYDSKSDVFPYTNTRGFEASGMIAKKIGYYTYLTTTQAAYPNYVRSWIDRQGVVPYEGFWKVYNTDGVDFFTARGYISFNIIKQINFQFGYDKLFLGEGIRTMGLSDFSNNFLFGKFDVKVWKLYYRLVIGQHYADVYSNPNSGALEGPYPRKYFAHHHLSFDIGKNLNLGFFENVAIGDSVNNSFDFSYLNPAIFFRAMEHQNGSSNNIIIGIDGKWNFLRRFSLYGQFVFDEFKIDEVTSGDGWWANKFGGQLGLKYMDALWLDNLDLILEFNIARPYTYGHETIYTNFAHYRMPLAHPYGANFREFITIARYQPFRKFSFITKFITALYGEDDDNTNWGKDVMESYITREQDYGNYIGQGFATNFNYLDFTATYHFKHNVFFDLQFVFRNVKSELDVLDDNTFYTMVHFRYNIPKKHFDF